VACLRLRLKLGASRLRRLDEIGVFEPRRGARLWLIRGGAIFLILELNHPFSGLFRVPSAPIERAIAVLGKSRSRVASLRPSSLRPI
jgi:hypothetical protein